MTTFGDQRIPYGGYFKTDIPPEDGELTHVGPGTPCGEFMRRFWQPVTMSSELKNQPLPVRVLGEDLVLFRKPDGALGLLHRHCAHRRASLEFGRIEKRGIRCCYHGWLYDVDGTILETPAEPASSPIKDKVCLGAYPVHEFMGLMFAYLGPPDEKPEFPIYDSFNFANDKVVPYAQPYPCNWLQVAENSMDHTHVEYLHSTISGVQFFDAWAKKTTLVYEKRPIGIYYAYTRRVGDMIWVGSEDIVLPNFTQAGSIFTMDAKTQKYFGRNSFTRWVVPIDDTNTRVMALTHFNDRSDPFKEEYLTKESLERIEIGVPMDRPYEERQRLPGDLEAIGSQGPINIHAKEHLGTSDRGVAMYRTRLRQAIRSLQKGERPLQPAASGDAPLPTYAGDSVLRIPRAPGGDDVKLLEDVSRQVLRIYVSADHVQGGERDQLIQKELHELELSYSEPTEIDAAVSGS